MITGLFEIAKSYINNVNIKHIHLWNGTIFCSYVQTYPCCL